jgi:LacI family transcriptional regulator
MQSTTAPRSKKRTDAVTMSDIARYAQVSRPTVSIVLNERHESIGIAESTRARVLQAAHDLGYRRNALARAVKTGRSLTLAFLAGDADIEYSARAFSGVLDEAEDTDYAIQRFRLYDRPEDDKVIERCAEHRMDGLIVNDTGRGLATDLIRREFEGKVPIVWLDPKGPQDWGVQVRPDDESGMAQAVESMVSLGHRHIAFVGGIEGVGTGVPRAKGFRCALESAGLDNSLLYWTQDSHDLKLKALDDLLTLPNRPTAIMCGSDALALLYLRELRAKGLNVPQDISIVGFGDLFRVDLADPALSTVRVQYKEMGREAVRQILQRIKTGDLSSEKQVLSFPTELVKRDSTGPVPD